MLLRVMPYTVYFPLIFNLAKYNTSHQLGLNFLCHFSAHLFGWSIILLYTLTVLLTVHDPNNRCHLQIHKPSRLCLLPSHYYIITNSRGPNKDPWGTTHITDLQPEYHPSTQTLFLLSLSQCWTHMTKSLLILHTSGSTCNAGFY